MKCGAISRKVQHFKFKFLVHINIMSKSPDPSTEQIIIVQNFLKHFNNVINTHVLQCGRKHCTCTLAAHAFNEKKEPTTNITIYNSCKTFIKESVWMLLQPYDNNKEKEKKRREKRIML